MYGRTYCPGGISQAKHFSCPELWQTPLRPGHLSARPGITKHWPHRVKRAVSATADRSFKGHCIRAAAFQARSNTAAFGPDVCVTRVWPALVQPYFRHAVMRPLLGPGAGVHQGGTALVQPRPRHAEMRPFTVLVPLFTRVRYALVQPRCRPLSEDTMRPQPCVLDCEPLERYKKRKNRASTS